jgi:hypothetical protein
MKHYTQSAHALETKLQQMQTLLTESKNDEKSEVIELTKDCQETLKDLRSLMSQRELEKAQEQRLFCDNLSIEFSISSDFSESYTRNYECMVLDMQTLKTLIYGERQLQNMSDDLLFARVTITDNDPEAC